MAGSKRKNIVWMIPEVETKESHSYHYSVVKTRNTIGEKFRFKKYNPVKRIHEWFKEIKAPGSS